MKLAAIAALIATGLARPAAADTSDRPEVIITDAASDALMATIFSDRISRGTNAAPFYVGAVGALVGGPVIHTAHGDYGRAGLSIGARVGLPLVGMLGGNAICMHDHDPNDTFLPCFGSLLIGGVIGLLGAEVLDWTVISRGPSDPMPIAHVISIGGSF